MADEPEVKPEAEAEVQPEPTAPTAISEPILEPESQPPPEPEREPGGDDPRDIRARKEYRARKRVEQELEQERLARIRFEERARVLEEQQKQQPKPKEEIPPVLSVLQLKQLVDSGQLDQKQAENYEIQVLQPYYQKQAIQKQREEDERDRPINTARERLGEYLQEFPGLQDRTDPDFNKVWNAYTMLTTDFRYPKDERAQLAAILSVKGDLGQIRKKREMDALTREHRAIPPAESPAGGNGAFTSNKIDLSKAPREMVSMWDRTATPQAAREKEFRYFLQSQKGK